MKRQETSGKEITDIPKFLSRYTVGIRSFHWYKTAGQEISRFSSVYTDSNFV